MRQKSVSLPPKAGELISLYVPAPSDKQYDKCNDIERCKKSNRNTNGLDIGFCCKTQRS